MLNCFVAPSGLLAMTDVISPHRITPKEAAARPAAYSRSALRSILSKVVRGNWARKRNDCGIL